MGDSASWGYDEDVAEERKSWNERSRRILTKLEAGKLRNVVKALLREVDQTQQTRFTWDRLEELKQMLKL